MLPVNDSNNAQFHRNDPAHQYIHSICTSIHQIQLGDHCQSSPALGIKHAWLKKKKKTPQETLNVGNLNVAIYHRGRPHGPL